MWSSVGALLKIQLQNTILPTNHHIGGNFVLMMAKGFHELLNTIEPDYIKMFPRPFNDCLSPLWAARCRRQWILGSIPGSGPV